MLQTLSLNLTCTEHRLFI